MRHDSENSSLAVPNASFSYFSLTFPRPFVTESLDSGYRAVRGFTPLFHQGERQRRQTSISQHSVPSIGLSEVGLKRTRRIEIVRYRRRITLLSQDSEPSDELEASFGIPGPSQRDSQGAPELPENTTSDNSLRNRLRSWFARQMWK